MESDIQKWGCGDGRMSLRWQSKTGDCQSNDVFHIVSI